MRLNSFGELLALEALLGKLHRILAHGRPIVPLSKALERKGFPPRMVPAHPTVYFLNQVLGFSQTNTPLVTSRMSPMIQLSVDKRVSCRGVLDPSGFFSILGQLRVSEVADNWVHPSSRVLGTENLLFSFDTRLVESFYGERDKTLYVIPQG